MSRLQPHATRLQPRVCSLQPHVTRCARTSWQFSRSSHSAPRPATCASTPSSSRPREWRTLRRSIRPSWYAHATAQVSRSALYIYSTSRCSRSQRSRHVLQAATLCVAEWGIYYTKDTAHYQTLRVGHDSCCRLRPSVLQVHEVISAFARLDGIVTLIDETQPVTTRAVATRAVATRACGWQPTSNRMYILPTAYLLAPVY